MLWWMLAVTAAFGIGLLVGRQLVRNREVRPVATVPHRTRVLFRAIPYALLVVDSQFRIEFSNDEATGLGLAASDGTLTPRLRDLARQAINREGTAESTIKLASRTGAHSQIYVVAKALSGESRAIVVAFDADAPLAARVAQREFIVNVSHELKTPVGAVSLMAEALEDAADDPAAVRVFAARIARESARLAVLVDQFIELSRLQSSHSVITTTATDIRDCVDEAVGAVQHLAEQHRVVLDTAKVASTMLVCEPRSVTSALRNLLDNAIRYSLDNRRVVVTSEVKGDDLEIAVIDQGVGIDSVDVPRIFERFFRADSARDRESGGTGIGLSIVKHVARQHGGRVDVWSEAGVGSTFTLVLPRHSR